MAPRITMDELMRAFGRPMAPVQEVRDMPIGRLPQPQPMQQPASAPQQAEAQRRGLLGFLGDRDARARLAIALEGMTLNPNQAYMQMLQEGVATRQQTKAATEAKNKTAAWLRSQGRDDLAAAVEAGVMSGQDAARVAITPAQGGYRQVSGAQLGLTGPDAEKLFNVSPDGQVTAIGGAGTTVNVDTGGAGEFEKAFEKMDAETINTVYNTGLTAARNIPRLDRLDALLQSAPSGAEGALKLAAGELGINTEGLSDLQAANALINTLVPEQRQPGSGEMSDADLAMFKQSLPRIINQPGGNALIIQTMRAIAEYDMQGAQIAQALRAGEIDRSTAFRMLQERRNPLADFRAPAAAQGGNGSQPVVIDGVTIRKVN